MLHLGVMLRGSGLSAQSSGASAYMQRFWRVTLCSLATCMANMLIFGCSGLVNMWALGRDLCRLETCMAFPADDGFFSGPWRLLLLVAVAAVLQ